MGQYIRAQRKQQDKAAPISDLFAMPNENPKKCYIPDQNLTVDEKLFAFRGRASFIMYIPSKPAKYGIKVWWWNDSKSYYPIKGQIYTGLANNGERDKNQGERVVKQLCKMNKGSGRQITCDNFITTLELAKFLPKELLPNKRREVCIIHSVCPCW